MEKLIDNGFKQDWQWIIGDRGELLWHDKPMMGFWDAVKESRKAPSGKGDSLGVVIITWIFVLIIVAQNLVEGEVFFGLMFAVFGLVLPFIGDLFYFYKTSKTEYVISRKAIFFRIFNGWKYKIYTLPMEDIIGVSLVGDNHERGTLHIITEKQVGFRTYNIYNRKRRDHPTIEYVRNSKLAYDIIQNRIRKNPPRKLKYKPPILLDWEKQVLQFFLCALIGVFVFLGLKFYLLPFLDSGVESLGYSIYLFLICIASLLIGLIKTFKEKEVKLDTVLPLIGINIWLILFCFLFYIFFLY